MTGEGNQTSPINGQVNKLKRLEWLRTFTIPHPSDNITAKLRSKVNWKGRLGRKLRHPRMSKVNWKGRLGRKLRHPRMSKVNWKGRFGRKLRHPRMSKVNWKGRFGRNVKKRSKRGLSVQYTPFMIIMKSFHGPSGNIKYKHQHKRVP